MKVLTRTMLAGVYCRLTAESDESGTIYAVQEYGYDVSEVFNSYDRAKEFFNNTERYEAAQTRKGRR